MISQPTLCYWIMVCSGIIWYLLKNYQYSKKCRDVFDAFMVVFCVWGALACGCLMATDKVMRNLYFLEYSLSWIVCVVTMLAYVGMFIATLLYPKTIKMFANVAIILIFVHLFCWLLSSYRYYTFNTIHDLYFFEKQYFDNSGQEYQKAFDQYWGVAGHVLVAPNRYSVTRFEKIGKYIEKHIDARIKKASARKAKRDDDEPVDDDDD